MDVQAFLASNRQQALDANRLKRRLRLRPEDRVLNVHDYGWPAYEAFTRKFYSDPRPRIVALSMNPGPYGAVQTGIPFCDTQMARTFLTDFDALIHAKPRWVAAERIEISARHLVRWSAKELGGITNLYDQMVLAMTCPLAILRGPKRTNVPLPALPRQEQEKIEDFLCRNAPHVIRDAQPWGIFLLGQWAERVWQLVQDHAPDLASLPSVAVPHPAAHISNPQKDQAWTQGLQALQKRRQGY